MTLSFRGNLYASVNKTLEGHSRRNWNTEHLQDMPGKILE